MQAVGVAKMVSTSLGLLKLNILLTLHHFNWDLFLIMLILKKSCNKVYEVNIIKLDDTVS